MQNMWSYKIIIGVKLVMVADVSNQQGEEDEAGVSEEK
jgi:hypothetical protein